MYPLTAQGFKNPYIVGYTDTSNKNKYNIQNTYQAEIQLIRNL